MSPRRHPANPVWLPVPRSDWDCHHGFNPGGIYHQGLFHMFYAPRGWTGSAGSDCGQPGRSGLAPMAFSGAGLQAETEARGVEDPRLLAFILFSRLISASKPRGLQLTA